MQRQLFVLRSRHLMHASREAGKGEKIKHQKETLTSEDVFFYCEYCGSTNVLRDATAKWNLIAQTWELCTTLDHADCEDCGDETHLREAPIKGRRNK